jgi:hypothetical protein
VDGHNIILDTRYYHGSLERIDEFEGTTRLTDLPAEWSRQHQMLGLPAQ